MRLNKWLLLFVFLGLNLLAPSLLAKDHKEEKTISVDGPYVLYEPSGSMRVISVSLQGQLKDTTYASVPKNFSFTVTPEKGGYPFPVALHPFKRPEWKTVQPEKVVVISDPHGDFLSFVSILEATKVIDRDYNWIFGKNELVIIGDVFDRGVDQVTIFWLIYKLEQEAMAAGGRVSFMLGNHEEMILRNNTKYTKKKYLALAEKLDMPYNALWAENSELGRWLRSKNLIQVIGTNLFVHAGLSAEFLKQNKSIPEVNRIASESLGTSKEKRISEEEFVFGNDGPYWYRGMVSREDKYKPLHTAELESLLKKYKVNRMYLGHTIFDDVTTLYNKKVIAVNVDNKENREKSRGRGVIIEKDKVSVIYDSGEQTQLIP